LVELLVVIAIIGVLVALLLPAVQAAREAARRSSCQNNIRQLALGILNYESAFTKGPGSSPYNGGTGASWIVDILPYLELGNVDDRIGAINNGDGLQQFSSQKGINSPEIRDIIESPLDVLRCPSDPNDQSVRCAGSSNVSVDGDVVVNHWQMRGVRAAATNYKGVHGSNRIGGNSFPYDATDPLDLGCLDTCECSGLLGRSSKECNYFPAITDGRSSTFMIGEDVPLYNAHSIWSFSNGDYSSTNTPLNYFTNQPSPCVWQEVMGFRSLHPGGAHFANADGSVHFVQESIALDTYRALSTRNGEEIADASTL